jgi:type IV pilus assembly protein PilA
MRRQRGFSTIELVIVVTIILIIAGVTIPNLMRSKIGADEASALGSMHTLNTGCIAYAKTFGHFPPSIAALGPGSPAAASAANLIGPVLATTRKNGYSFTYKSTAPFQTYTITASPTAPGITGQRTFFTDQSRVVRADGNGGQATVASAPIGQEKETLD